MGGRKVIVNSLDVIEIRFHESAFWKCAKRSPEKSEEILM
jgi:hypothetical protein